MIYVLKELICATQVTPADMVFVVTGRFESLFLYIVGTFSQLEHQLRELQVQYEELQTSFNFKDLKVVAGDLVYTFWARDIP